jgi:hypothetical protein
MTQVQVHLEKPEEEADEAFELHAGQIGAEDLIDELEDAELENEEALETELEKEHGIPADGVVANGPAADSLDTTIDGVDVEAGLDELLLLRTLGEEELEELEAREGWRGFVDVAEDEIAIVPRRHRGEFVCRGCFLVKARSQLADAHRHLCLDCV